MRERIMKNSKKGFSLPLAIGISAFLIIISASLLFIAVQSTSTTSVQISGRQAYLNVRSAIEYAQSYYNNNVTDYSAVGTEYLIMNDMLGGTTEKGAKVSTSENDAQKAITYVRSEYIKGTGSNKTVFKLTAYSRYSDSFGNKAAVARLSVSFTVGSTQPNRITVASLPIKQGKLISQDKINLHIKKPASMNSFDLTYYIWTYDDTGKAYSGYKSTEKSGSTSLTYDDTSAISYSKLNQSTVEDNTVRPNAEWMNHEDKARNLQKGPNGIVSNDGNNWFGGEYFIRDGRVPWFNIIFAQRGSVLAGTNGPTNIYDSQTNEMLHLWYLDPSDKNIYFEFIDRLKVETGNNSERNEKPGTKYYTKYYEGSDWNGTDGLEDTILVYVNTPKTLVHFAIEGVDNGATRTSLVSGKTPKITEVKNSDSTKPINGISYIGSGNKKTSDIDMAYEGCGWWVANVETNDVFDITFSTSGATGIQATNVSPTDKSSSKRELWFVYHPASGALDVCEDEAVACGKRGILYESYVTVHAKVADYKSSNASPRLTYTDVGLNSSTGRTDLIDTLLFYDGVIADNYSTSSYTEFKKHYDKGWEMIDNKKFIENVFIDSKGVNTKPDATDAEKIIRANELYEAQIELIENAFNNLQLNSANQKEIGDLNAQVKAGRNIEKSQEDAYKDGAKDLPVYDYEVYAEFIAEDSLYSKAKAALSASSLTGVEARHLTTGYTDEEGKYHPGLKDDIDMMRRIREKDAEGNIILKGGKINRDSLKNKITAYEKYIDSTDYEQQAVIDFKKAWNKAVDSRDKKKTTQDELDKALTDLINAFTELSKHSKGENLDKTEINKYIKQAGDLLADGSVTYTAASRTALQSAYDEATEKVGKVKTKIELDNLTDKLVTAVRGYNYPKPKGSLKELKSRGMIRVWVYGDGAPANTDFILTAHGVNNSTITTLDYGTMTSWGDNDDEALKDKLGYNYMDFDLNVYEKVYVEAMNAEGEVYGKSEEIKLADVADGNIVFVISDKDVTVGKLVSFYAMVEEEQSVKLKYGSNGIKRAFLNTPYYEAKMVFDAKQKGKFFNMHCTTFDSLTGKEVVSDYISDVAINEPGDYVIKVVKNGTQKKVYTVTPDDILPADNGSVPSDPSAGGVLATEDLEIMNVAETNNDYVFFTDLDKYAGGNTSSTAIHAYFFKGDNAVGTAWPGDSMTYHKTNDDNLLVFKAKIPAGAEYVIFNNNKDTQTWDLQVYPGYGYVRNTNYDNENKFGCNTWQEGNNDTYTQYKEQDGYVYFTNNKNWTNLHIYFWGGDQSLAKWPGYILNDFYKENDQHQKIYKIKPPVGANKMIINDGSNQKTEDIEYKLGYGYYIKGGSSPFSAPYWNESAGEEGGGDGGDGGDGGGGGGTYGQDGYIEDELTGDSNATSDIPLAYVGGSKVRITNKSYGKDSSGTRKKNSYGNSISDDKFGGERINANSGGRLGKSQLSPYYDWYEVKLPISNQARYTFALTGMSSSNSEKDIQTKTVTGASGDVWLEQLDNERGGKGHFRNINLYTFDPEKKENGVLPETLTIYFKCPTKSVDTDGDGIVDTTVSWQSPSVTFNGPFIDEAESTPLTKKLKRDVNKNIYYIDGISKNTPFIEFSAKDYNGKTKQYIANLQGGDYILFDPELNKGLGQWTTFVSDQDKLRNAVEELRSMYYGYSIFDNQDSSGAIYTDGDGNSAERLYSQGLVSLVSKYSETKTTNGCTFYVMKIDEIMSKTEDQAWKEYNGDLNAAVGSDEYYGLRSVIDNYKNLYSLIFKERAYIQEPLTSSDMKIANGNNDFYYPSDSASGKFIVHKNAGGFYNEYVTRTLQSRKYDPDTISALRRKLASAEVVYLRGGTYSQVEKAAQALQRAHDGLVKTSEGSICCIFYDVSRKVQKGYSYKLRYKESEGGSEKETSIISDLNPDKYPIVFLTSNINGGLSSDTKTIYDVKFVEYSPGNSTTPKQTFMAKDKMSMDETWVYIDDQSKPEWAENCVYDYRQIDSDIFIQEDANDKRTYKMKSEKTVTEEIIGGQVVQIEKTVYKTMVLHFAKDSQVNRYTVVQETVDGETVNVEKYVPYTIKAGAYYFYDKDTKPLDEDGLERETPILNGVIDLYSDEAQNYFTSAYNYGAFVNGKKDANGETIKGVMNGNDVGWFIDGKFKSGGVQKEGYVNFEQSTGNFATANDYQYYASKGLYFRWSGEKELLVAKGVSFASDELRIASNATIDGSRYTNGAHFYLVSGSDEDSMIVTFLTDIFVKYKDKTGKIVEFSIREGKYLIEKDPSRVDHFVKVDYVADLFDIDYWKKMEHVTCLDRSGTGSGSKSGKLQDGVFGE